MGFSNDAYKAIVCTFNAGVYGSSPYIAIKQHSSTGRARNLSVIDF